MIIELNNQKVCNVFYFKELDFFGDWDEFFGEWNLKENNNEVCKRPTYAYATKKIKMHIDAKKIVKDATEDLYEGAYYDIPYIDIKGLQACLDKWCENCGVSDTYSINYECKVEIPWVLYDEMKKEKEN